MTDLPELIANVYRACGWNAWKNDDGKWVIWKTENGIQQERREGGIVGLDDFIRDIVPTLNERGWSYSIGNNPSGRRHLALIWKRNADALFEVSKGSPVEACFRAAWEALG